jgi:hypothetical protein
MFNRFAVKKYAQKTLGSSIASLRNCFTNEVSVKKTPPKMVSYFGHVPKRKTCAALYAITTFLLMFASAAARSRFARFFVKHSHAHAGTDHTQSDDSRPVFVTGNFNGWVNPGRALPDASELNAGRLPVHLFSEPLNLPASRWNTNTSRAAGKAKNSAPEGLPPANRRMEVPRGKVTDVSCPAGKYTATGTTRSFTRTFRCSPNASTCPNCAAAAAYAVLLPWNYDETSGKRYPVLYLQDGQNLFEDDAPFGTWGVDKQLAALAQQGKRRFHRGRHRPRRSKSASTGVPALRLPKMGRRPRARLRAASSPKRSNPTSTKNFAPSPAVPTPVSVAAAWAASSASMRVSCFRRPTPSS